MKTCMTDVNYLIHATIGAINIHMDDKYIALREGNELQEAMDNLTEIHKLLLDYVVEETA